MKSIRNIAFSALLTLGAFSAITYTACNKDECKDVVCQNGGTCTDGTCACPFAYTGANCETEVRSNYYKTYKGNGSDNEGDTYTNFGLRFRKIGTDAKVMGMELLDNTNDPLVDLNVTLQTATTFTVTSKTEDGTTYTGSGTVDATKASLTLNAKDNNLTLIFTFSNMLPE